MVQQYQVKAHVGNSIMQLTLSEMRRLNGLFNRNHSREDLLNATADLILKRSNENILNALSTNSFDPALLNYCIQIGTVLRKSEGTLAMLSRAFFYSLNDILEKKDTHHAQQIVDTRFLIFETIKKAKRSDQFLDLGGKIVWFDEEEKIRDLLDSIQPNEITPNEINNFWALYKKELNQFMIAGNVFNIKNLLKEIISVAKKINLPHALEARKVLRYLVLSNDVIPDHLGLFGLADDLHVINNFCIKLHGADPTHQLLHEFTNFSDTALSTFFERKNSEIGISKLTASSPQINYILSTVKYLYENETKKILAIVPEPGVLGFLLILDMLTVTGKQSIGLANDNVKVGDKIFFNLPRKSIVVKYLGEHENYPDLFWVGDIDSNKSEKDTKSTLPKFALSMCTKIPKAKKIIEDSALISEWQKSRHDFIPAHITFSGRGAKIYFLTRKNRFESLKTEIQPFGLELPSFIDFDYQTDDYSEAENYKTSRPKVTVFSNPEMLIERIEEDNKNVFIVSDEPVLANDFLKMFTDGFGNEEINFIFISTLEDVNLNEIATQHKFSHVYFPSQLKNLDKINHNIVFNDTLSKLEDKYFRSTKEKKLLFHEKESDVFLSFSENYFEVLKEKDANPNLISDKIIRKLFQARTKFFSRWIPFNENEKEEVLIFIDEVLELLSKEYEDSQSLRNLYNLFKQNCDELINVPIRRGVYQFLLEHQNDDLIVLEQRSTSKNKSQKFIDEEGLENVQSMSVAEIKGQFLNCKLLVPYHMNKKTNRYLNQNNTADTVDFFLFKNEEKEFYSHGKRIAKTINRFERETRKTFARMPVSRIFEKIKIDDVQETKEVKDTKSFEEISEYENAFLNSKIRFTDSSNFLDSVDALPVFLDEKKSIIMLRPSSKILQMTETYENESSSFDFIENKAADLVEGDKVCVAANSKSDIFEELAIRTNKNYTSIKFKAASWRRELQEIFERAFHGNINNFASYLKMHGIKREIPTIKNWFVDSVMIAPRDYKNVLNSMLKLNVSDDFKKGLGNTLDAIEKCYKLRRESSAEILKILNSKSNIKIRENEISLTYGQVNLNFMIHEVDFIGETKNVPLDQLWVVNDL